MPEDRGRINYSTRSRKFQVFYYVGKRDVKIGEYDTREEAAQALQREIAVRRHKR